MAVRISVIMGVYRPDRELLKRAVDSILNQSFPPYEFIICDDGSSDGTFEFLTSLADKDKRLQILRHAQNRGLAAALNTCLDSATGEYIARQDADDYSSYVRLEKQIAYLCENKNEDVVGCAINMYDDTGVWAIRKFPGKPVKEDFLFTLPFMHGTLLFRAEVIKKYLYKSSRLTIRAEDSELLMRMYADGVKAANICEALYYYREDKNSQTRRKYIYRVYDVVLRAQGFKKLGLLPQGIPYILKPLFVGIVPQRLLFKLKKIYYRY